MDRLPYDLKVGIFAMLPLRDRVRCTGVSREWRELVMDEWDTFEVRKTRLSLNAPSMFKQELGQWVLNHIPPHQIRRFEVRGDEEDYHQAIQVLQQGQFSRLEFLLLSKSIFSPAEETAVFPLCIIQACHAHLTELHLGSVSLQNDAGSWLSSVLSICKRLTHLMFYQSGGDSQSRLPLHVPLQADLALTYLCWCSYSTLDIARFLPRCPRLISLRLWPTALAEAPNDIETILAHITSWCPELKVLRVDANSDPVSQPPSCQTGLQTLCLTLISSLDDALLSRFIKAHRHTLLHLCLHVWLSPGTDLFHDILQPDTPSRLPLQSFDFHLWHRHGTPEPRHLSLHTFLRLCPDLCHLKLANFSCDERHLLGSLASCPRLVALYLHSLTETRSEDTTTEYDIENIETTATVSVRLPLLKHLTVRACSGITDVWAYGMDDLTSLESITFTRHSHNGMTERGKQHLLEKAPHVQKLDWKAGDAEDIPGIQVSVVIGSSPIRTRYVPSSSMVARPAFVLIYRSSSVVPLSAVFIETTMLKDPKHLYKVRPFVSNCFYTDNKRRINLPTQRRNKRMNVADRYSLHFTVYPLIYMAKILQDSVSPATSIVPLYTLAVIYILFVGRIHTEGRFI